MRTAIFTLAALAAALVALADPGPPRIPDEAARIAAFTALTADPALLQRGETFPGGAATVAVPWPARAFTTPMHGLETDRAADFLAGLALIDTAWVTAPSSILALDGLGPLFNAASCTACHIGGGRGFASDAPGDLAPALVVQLTGPDGRSDPVYGAQVQTIGAHGQLAEARLSIRYDPVPVTLAGGEVVTLRDPVIMLDLPGYGSLQDGTVLAPRIAQQLVGLGLIEAISAADIIALADPDDADGDGISGRASLIGVGDGAVLGRFGHQARVATLPAQVAIALHLDMGLSTPIHSAPQGDCTAAQPLCLSVPHGAGDARVDEVSGPALDLITAALRYAGVPLRRDADDPQVMAGRALFHATGCAACHRPAFVTARLPDDPARSFQLIWPYSDLLLHDLGPGLADGGAAGQEWRTAPLWGIGLTQMVSGATGFLHDGRARTVTEAILWHAGEGQAARDGFAALPPAARATLLRFVDSL